MGIEHKRRNAQTQNRHPEVQQIWRPQRQCHVEQHDQRAHPQIDTRARKTREENAERVSCGGETAAGSDVAGTSKSEIAENRVSVDLR